jgi:hypothetical protein
VETERDKAPEAERQPLAWVLRELAGGCQTIGNECGGDLDDLEPAGTSLAQIQHQDRMASKQADAEHDGSGIEDKDRNPIADVA